MKRKANKIILSILIIVLSFGLLYLPVNADSGWDSNYDSGGGYSSSSDGGVGYDSSDSFDNGILIVLLVVVIIVERISINRYNKKKTKTNYYKDVDIQKAKEIDPTINIEEFKINAYNIYKEFQTAWMNFDMDTIRKLTTDKTYNIYSSELETLKLKGRKNIINDITLEEIKIIDIKKENNIITTNVYLRVKCYNYVIDEKTDKIVDGKNKETILAYILTFVKSDINNKIEEKCPSCGSLVDINSSSHCPYCEGTLAKKSKDYVMNEKKCIGQYWKGI